MAISTITGVGINEEQEGFFSKTGQALTLGVAGAAVSAVNSFINTGIELGNALGGDFDQIDNEETIARVFGDSAAEYYAQNSEVVDIAGLVVGSFVPGGAAIKAARALSAGKLATQGTARFTGWARAMHEDRTLDFLLNEVRHNRRPDQLQGNRMYLAANGLVKSATESLVFEAATLITMNQSQALSADDAGYFESIGNNLGMAAFGVAFGTAIGTPLAYASSASKIVKMMAADEHVWKKGLLAPDQAATTLAGDYITYANTVLDQIDTRLAEISQMAASDKALHANELRKISGLRAQMQDAIIAKVNSNSTFYGVDIGGTVQQRMSDMDASSRSLFARLEKVTPLPKPTRTEGVSGHVVSEADAELPSLFVDKYVTQNIDTLGAVARMEDDLLKARLPEADAQDLFLQAAGLLKASTIKKLWQDDAVARVTLKDAQGNKLPFDRLPEEHQLKLISPKDGKPITEIRTALDIRTGLVNLLADFDPMYARIAEQSDEYLSLIAETRRLGTGFSDEQAEGLSQLLTTTALDPRELFSAAYRVLNRTDLDRNVEAALASPTSKHRATYEYLKNNGALRSKYGASKQNINLRTFDVTDTNTVPYFSDLGKMHIDKLGTSAGKHTVSATPASVGKFKELDSTDTSGMFAWAVSRSGAGAAAYTKGGILTPEYAKQLTSDNLVMLTAVRAHHNFDTHGGVRLADTGEVLNTRLDLDLALYNAKLARLKELSEDGRLGLSDSDIAMRADVDKEFFYAYATRQQEELAEQTAGVMASSTRGRNLEEFGSAHYTSDYVVTQGAKGENFNPQHAQFQYAAGTLDDLGIPMDSLVYVQQRMANQRHIEQQAAIRAIDLPTDKLESLGIAANGQGVTTYKDITLQDGTTTLLTGQSADTLTGAAIAQERGRQRAAIRTRDEKAIRKHFDSVIRNVKAVPDQGGLQELSILFSSVLRQDNFAMGSRATLGLETDEVKILEGALGIDLSTAVSEYISQNAGVIAAGVTDLESATFLINKVGRDKLQDAAASILPKGSAEQLAEAGPETIAIMQQAAQSGVARYMQTLREVFDVQAGVGTANNVYHLKHPAVADFLRATSEANKHWYLEPMSTLRQAENSYLNIDPERLYPGRPNLERTPHYALMRQRNSATNPWSGQDSGYLLAVDEADLARKIAHVKGKYGDDVIIQTGDEIKSNFKARQAYEFELDMTESGINSALRSENKLWDISPQFNPHILEDFMQDFVRRRENVVTKGLGVLYREDINGLMLQDAAFTTRGQFGKKTTQESAYAKQVNLMLGLPTGNTSKAWQTIQDTAGSAISKTFNVLNGKRIEAQTSKNWEGFSDLLERYGLPKLVTGKEDWVTSNLGHDRNQLGQLVGRLNGALSFGMLKLDAAHHVVNAVSMPILAMPAMSSLKRRLETLDAATLERLNIITSAPAATGMRVPSNTKLLYQANANFFNQKELVAEFEARSLIGSDVVEMRNLVDAVSYTPTGDWGKRIKEATDTMSIPADWTENYLRFVSGDMARQVLEASGVTRDSPLYWSTISAVINQVNGNYVANQRAGLFQGWVGSAIGLFQTYQFNLINQFSKHMGDNGKAAASMMAIQTGVFGAQSLPGFSIMNQYLGEKAQGRKDIYSLVGDTLDNPVAEFLLYGGGSSLTRPILGGEGLDLFTRGNLNPRSVTIIPSKIEDVPAFGVVANAWKFAANILGGAIDGDPMNEVALNALAHNGMVRPIQGLAQIIRGQRTTQQGSTLMTYEDMSAYTAIAKLMGTQTLTEGVATNAYYRSMGYRSARMADLADLAKSTRQHLRGGSAMGQDTVGLLREYVARGGDAKTFNRWYTNQVAGAEEGLVQQARDSMTSIEGKYLQGLLGRDVGGLSQIGLGEGL